MDASWAQRPKGWEGGRQRTKDLRIIPTLQIEESTTVVTSQSAEVRDAETALTELRRTVQSLEIDLESMRNLVRVLTSPAPTPLGPTSVCLKPILS